MRTRLLAALCIPALIACLLLPALIRAGIRPQPLPSLPPVAVQVSSNVPDSGQLNMLQAAGVKAVRGQVIWSAIERVQGTYDWASSDAVLLPYVQRGIGVQVQICCSPRWMAPYSNDFGPWLSWHAADFGRFMAALVTRYSRYRLEVFEVGNEPDLAFGPGKEWVYGLYLREAYQQAHAASPNVTIISGGLAYEGAQSQQFVAVNAQALRDYTDLVGFHWYPPVQYGTQYATAFHKLDAIKAQIGEGKQYLLNEVGVDSRWNGWTEQRQANDLTALLSSLQARPDELVGSVWFAWRDEGWSEGFANSGVTRHDNSPKPAYWALRDVLR